MRSYLLMLVSFFFITSPFFGESKILPELRNPGAIQVDRDGIYINDGARVHILSHKTLGIVKSFGKRGEGPGEFKTHRNINRGGVGIGLHSDFILISSQGRVSFFTKKGELIKEINSSDFFNEYVPASEEFIGFKLQIEKNILENLEVILLDKNFKKKRTIGKTLLYDRREKLDATHLLKFPQILYSNGKAVYNDLNGKIYIFNNQTGKTKIFEPSGREGTKLSVSDQRKKRYINTFNNDPRFSQRGGYEALKKILEFPSFFPLSRTFRVDGNSIYIITFREKTGKKELLEFNLDGNLVNESYIRIDEMNAIELYPFTIFNNQIYQLVENEDEESWVLKVENIY